MFHSARHLTSLTLFVAILVGCDANSEAPIVSPSGEYAAVASVQDSIVYIHLSSPEGEELHEVRSGASDFQKWAIGWMPERDTIVFYSSDIGTLAYDLVDGRLLRIDDVSTDPELIERAKDLYNLKYN